MRHRRSLSDAVEEVRMNARRFAWLLAVVLCVTVTAPQAAEVKVLATVAVKAVMDGLVPVFERESGHKVAIQFGTSAMLRKQIDGGEHYDVVILTPPEYADELVKQGRLAADSVARFAATHVGLAVRAGAPRPDIGSEEALKKALLAARSVGYSDPALGGTSGVHAKALIERLGIANELASKVKVGPVLAVVEMVANGEVELGFAQLSEIASDARLQLVGPLRPPFEKSTLISLGVRSDSKEGEAARMLTQFLRSPAAAEGIKARGMEPALP